MKDATPSGDERVWRLPAMRGSEGRAPERKLGPSRNRRIDLVSALLHPKPERGAEPLQ